MRAADEHAALMEMHELRAKDALEKSKALARAVSDVMDATDEHYAVYLVARRRGVPEDTLREELKARGWVPPHVRGRRRSS